MVVYDTDLRCRDCVLRGAHLRGDFGASLRPWTNKIQKEAWAVMRAAPMSGVTFSVNPFTWNMLSALVKQLHDPPAGFGRGTPHRAQSVMRRKGKDIIQLLKQQHKNTQS